MHAFHLPPFCSALSPAQNHFAHELLTRLYAGNGPSDLERMYSETRLIGYGGGALGDHFAPWLICPMGNDQQQQAAMCGLCCNVSVASAIDVLKRSPRFAVVSTLLQLVFRLKRQNESGSSPRFDLAVHVRRGDRLWVERSVEKITVWSERAILQQMQQLLLQTSPDAAPSSSSGATARPKVLLASDDNAYLTRLRDAVQVAGMDAEVVWNGKEAFDENNANRSLEAAKVCSAACVPELLATLPRFANAQRLMVSSKSNFGGFLLSSWGAANEGRVPLFFDLDNVLRREAMPRRYFCDLPWVCTLPYRICLLRCLFMRILTHAHV